MQLNYMYDIKVVGYEADRPMADGMNFHYGLIPDGSRHRRFHITHGSKPYRYNKKAPTKIGVIFDGKTESICELRQQALACDLLFNLNSYANVKATHNDLFAFAPTLRRRNIVVETAPVPFATQANAWQLASQLMRRWDSGSFTFVFDRRDFSPTLLPKFLAFWEYALLQNETSLFSVHDTIGGRPISRMCSGADYIRRAPEIPYIDQNVGISHHTRVPREFRFSDSMFHLMNRNHIKVKLLDIANFHVFGTVLQALDCSLSYLREVSLRNAGQRKLKHLYCWCLEQSDRREAYPDFVEYFETVGTL